MDKSWFNKSINEVQEELCTNLVTGLSEEEYTKSLSKYGRNELKARKKKTTFQKFVDNSAYYFCDYFWNCWSN